MCSSDLVRGLVLGHRRGGEADHVEAAHQVHADHALVQVERVRAFLAQGPGRGRDARAIDQHAQRGERARGLDRRRGLVGELTALARRVGIRRL